jgi:hypothetical protein
LWFSHRLEVFEEKLFHPHNNKWKGTNCLWETFVCFWHVYDDVDGDALRRKKNKTMLQTFYAIFEFFPLLFALSFACYRIEHRRLALESEEEKAQQEYSNDEPLLLLLFVSLCVIYAKIFLEHHNT